MDTTKTVLIIGGLAVGALVVYSLVKKNAANQAAYLNQPGLEGQAGTPAPAQNGFSSILDSIIGSSTNGGMLGSLGSAFKGTTDLNDPGLESNDPTDFSGMNYTMANSDPYQLTDPQAIFDSVNN